MLSLLVLTLFLRTLNFNYFGWMRPRKPLSNLSEPSPGNADWDHLMGLQLDTCPLGVLKYVNPEDLKALDATCFAMAHWSEIRSHSLIQNPIVESDPEYAARFRLWGPTYK